jgi:glycosyltransferase involved in cell wall biosynthesis
MVLVSIVIPTYNRKREFLRALRSVLDQSHTEIEVIVVNDNHADTELFEEIGLIGDNRIKCFYNLRTKGGNGSRNTGALNSKGEYIAFLDDDDEFLPEYIENKVNLLNQASCEYGVCLSNYYFEKGRKWEKSNLTDKNCRFADLFTGELDFGASSNIFIKREVFEKVGLWDEELLRQQDLDYMVRIMHNSRLILDHEFLLKVYGHNEPNSLKSFEQRELYNEKIAKYVLELDPADRKMYYSHHFRRQAKYLMKLRKRRKGFEYWKKAMDSKTVSIRKDVRIIMGLFQGFL